MIKSWLKSPSGEKFTAAVSSRIIKMVLWSTRGQLIDHGGYAYARGGNPVILAIWHGRMLALPLILNGTKVSIITSPSRDGRIISMICKPFGIGTIWGSSSTNALSGYRDMRRHLSAGGNVAITPDGPRGPARKAAPGAVTLAKASGVPIIPISWSADRMRRVDSWDQAAFPRFLSKTKQIWGAPITVPKNADSAMIDEYCIKLEDAINALSREGDTAFGHTPDDAEARYGAQKEKR